MHILDEDEPPVSTWSALVPPRSFFLRLPSPTYSPCAHSEEAPPDITLV